MILLPEDGILYHGSYTEISLVDLNYCRYGLDFGKGFYLTSSLFQNNRSGQGARFCKE